MAVDRRTVDLSGYPDLVVIYLGMRVNAWYGLKRVIGLGKPIQDSVAARPDGLLLHENFILSLFPVHAGMRQYWRDWESLERWSRSEPHRLWWQNFLRDSGGTGFWHEAYLAPTVPARGAMLSARRRARRDEAPVPAPVVGEVEYHEGAPGDDPAG